MQGKHIIVKNIATMSSTNELCIIGQEFLLYKEDMYKQPFESSRKCPENGHAAMEGAARCHAGRAYY